MEIAALRLRLPPARGVDRAGAAGGSRGVANAGGRPARGDWQDRSFREFPVILPPRRLPGAQRFARVSVAPVWDVASMAPADASKIFLTRPGLDRGLTWEALVRPGRKMRTGERVIISDGSVRRDPGSRRIWRADGAPRSERRSLSKCWIGWDTCRCRRTSSAPMTAQIASVIRRCSRGSADRWPRRPRGCISRLKFWMRAARRGRRSRA